MTASTTCHVNTLLLGHSGPSGLPSVPFAAPDSFLHQKTALRLWWLSCRAGTHRSLMPRPSPMQAATQSLYLVSESAAMHLRFVKQLGCNKEVSPPSDRDSRGRCHNEAFQAQALYKQARVFRLHHCNQVHITCGIWRHLRRVHDVAPACTC